ncbi:MAG: methyltransferase domain-containing protein [Rubrobacteraceae bacterium]
MPGPNPSALRENVNRRVLFMRSMLAQPRQVGAVWPTSRRAVRDLLDMGDIPKARIVVEFGVGTGVYTQQIVERLGPEATFLAFEIDPKLASAVSRKLEDPRLQVINDSAENVEEYLEGQKADIVVSSLPFTTFPAPLRESIMAVSRRILSPAGMMLVLQYSPKVLPLLQNRFSQIRRRISPLNVPPAFLYACQDPGPERDV